MLEFLLTALWFAVLCAGISVCLLIAVFCICLSCFIIIEFAKGTFDA